MKTVIILFMILALSSFANAISNSSKVNIVSIKNTKLSSSETSPPDEKKISYFFQKNDCTSIFVEFEKRNYRSLTALEIAIVASCEPAGKDPEKMFKFAEDKEPKNDFIILLHARYRWKKYFVNAMDLWLKLAKEATDPRIKLLAQEYVDSKERTDFFFENFFTPTGYSFQVSSFWESNPAQYANSDALSNTESSFGTSAIFTLIRHKDFNFGYLDGTISFLGTQYYSNPDVNYFGLDINGGLTIPTSIDRSFILKPIGNLTGLSGNILNTLAGFSLGEIWNFENSQLMVLLSLAADKYHQGSLAQQQGTHKKLSLHYNYTGIETLNISSIFSGEGTQAGQDINGIEVIPYTNAQYTLQLAIQKNFEFIQMGLNLSDTLRIDDAESQYLDSSNTFTHKRRTDNSISSEAWVLKRYFKKLDLSLYFRYLRTDSNMNSTDITDRNIKNTILGINGKMNF